MHVNPARHHRRISKVNQSLANGGLLKALLNGNDSLARNPNRHVGPGRIGNSINQTASVNHHSPRVGLQSRLPSENAHWKQTRKETQN
jgi:hypothetical protein